MAIQYQQCDQEKKLMNIVVVGHVDHGKSTVIGRLLADTDSLPNGKLEQVRHHCERNSKPFEYAFLIDALKEEQSQGITIDSARVFFKTSKRKYIIIDAPGHIEFLKNMVTGASRAQAALLVIDAREGIQENSKRHGYLLSLLGIRQVAVLVNKMDLVGYDQRCFDGIVRKYSLFLKHLGVEAVGFIPISAREGEGVAYVSGRQSWYQGPSVLKMLDRFHNGTSNDQFAFRMPVQDVYKFTKFGDDRRLIAGSIVSGAISAGDEVVFYPSGKKSAVKTIERFSAPLNDRAVCGQAIGLTLTEQIYTRRGEIMVKAHESAPSMTSRIRASIFWLGRKPLAPDKRYVLKLGTARVGCRLDKIMKSIDAVSLQTDQGAGSVSCHEAAEVILDLERAIAFDRADLLSETGRFVIVDDYEIAGGGIILEGLQDCFEEFRHEVFSRNDHWVKSDISREQRAERYGQRPALIIVTGQAGEERKQFARTLERYLFEQGRYVYFLGIGNVIHGVDADVKVKEVRGKEHLRRLAEVGYLMLDAGMILIMTAINLSQQDLEVIRTIVDEDLIEVVWVGKEVSTDIHVDFKIDEFNSKAVSGIHEKLAAKLNDTGKESPYFRA